MEGKKNLVITKSGSAVESGVASGFGTRAPFDTGTRVASATGTRLINEMASGSETGVAILTKTTVASVTGTASGPGTASAMGIGTATVTNTTVTSGIRNGVASNAINVAGMAPGTKSTTGFVSQNGPATRKLKTPKSGNKPASGTEPKSAKPGNRPASDSCNKSRSRAKSGSHMGPKASPRTEANAIDGSPTVTEVNTPSTGAANTQSPRRRKPKQSPKIHYNEDHPLKIIVTGFPPYSQPQDLTRAFGRFGAVSIDVLNAKFAALSFASEAHAAAAVRASGQLVVYGELLHVRAYSRQRVSQLCARAAPKPDVFPLSKEKERIIEPSMLDFSGSFEEQLERMLAKIRLTQEQVAHINSLYGDVEQALQAVWPGCVAIPFGSIPAGLGVQWSDADCFVLLPPEHQQHQHQQQQHHLPHQRHQHQPDHVRRAKRRLEDFRQVFTEIIAIPQANTPIVKFFHIPTKTNCDLSFKTPLGTQNTKLVASMLQADPRLLPAALTLKYWARALMLSGTGRLSSYALTMLLLAYLQVRGALPAVRELQAAAVPAVPAVPVPVSPAASGQWWDASFAAPRRCALPPRATALDVVGGFFEYYAAFEFERLCVCPWLGAPLAKEAFAEARRAPPELRRYRDHVVAGRVMPLRHATPLVVQDPFEHNVNVASAIGARFAAEIRSLIRFAADAYAAGKADGHRQFLRTILTRRPPPLDHRGPPQFRLHVYPRMVVTLVDPDWKSTVRKIVFTIFEKMLHIKLGKVEEHLDSDGKKEKYSGTLTKTVWKRRPFSAYHALSDLDFEERQARITEDILKLDEQMWNIEFHLVLTFRHAPDRAMITIALHDGDKVGFRNFGKFFVTMMQSWLTVLLKQHARPAQVPDVTSVDDSDVEDDKPYNDTVISMVIKNSTLDKQEN